MAVNYDAFTAGTELGGMRIKSDIRILVCYMLKTIDASFPRAAFCEALGTTALANFFEVSDALAAVSDAGLAVCERREDDDYYTLTDAGREVADRLETDIPKHVRSTAVTAAIELLARMKAKGGTEARIEKLPKGYHVVLSVKDGDTLMMQTVLYAADSLQANSLCESFLEHPETLYSGVVEALTR